MSLESFFGLDDADSQGNGEASEKFREQLRKNSAAIKAMAGNQKKRKVKEDRLAKILVRFLQDQSQSDLVFLVVKLLQENIPGAFILAIITLGNMELEEELHKNMLEHNADKQDTSDIALFSVEDNLPELRSLPADLRRDLNAWGEGILKAGLMMPHRTLQTVLTPEMKLKSLVLDLIDFVLEEYFERHGMNLGDTNTQQFALLSVQAILLKLKEASEKMSDEELMESETETN